MPLHLNINNLLSARTVESERIEYKESWNPDAIYRTICAFANDVEHTGGGYILIGVEVVSYPIPALEEIVVNAFYHRDYQQREPIEVRIYPNSIIFLNYGGPDRSIRLESFGQGQTRPRRYRNRRLGEFLKELELTEGRATGIPTILKSLRDNGSPPPRFDTDDGRSYFEVELFIHPEFIAKEPFVPPVGNMLSTLEDVDAVLKGLLEYHSADSDSVIKLIEEDNQAQ